MGASGAVKASENSGMNDIVPTKCRKLLARTTTLIREMDQTKDITIHRHINQFYYMQKNAELAMLLEMLCEQASDRLALISFITDKYKEMFYAWRNDVRWLTSHLNQQLTRSQTLSVLHDNDV